MILLRAQIQSMKRHPESEITGLPSVKVIFQSSACVVVDIAVPGNGLNG